jgi:carbonic anhydrase
VTDRILEPRCQEDWRHARDLVEEYAASLDFDLCFQDFARELDCFELEYAPPDGAFLLAARGSEYVGCVGLRRFSGADGEIKRLYVRPAARGLGIGRLLVAALIGSARQLGYARLLLDTLPSMREAQSLYLSLGFRPTAPYRPNPIPGASFLALGLEPNSSLSAR